MSSELLVKVRLDWSGPDHYDRKQNLPCRECGEPTKMRDRGVACHHSCAEQALAREIYSRSQELIAERFGYSEQELTDELLGQPGRPATRAADERVPTPAARLAADRGGER